MALIFAMSCLLIKNEGLYWLLTFIPAMIVVTLPSRKAAFILLTLLLVTSVVLWLFPRDFVVAGHSLEQLDIHYRSSALPALVKSFTTHDNWHLFAYLLLAVVPTGYFLAGKSRSQYLGIGAALASAVGLFLILFLFTGHAHGAIYFTSVGRIALQLVPSLLFLIMLLYHEASHNWQEK